MNDLAARLSILLAAESWGDFLSWAMMLLAFGAVAWTMHRQDRVLAALADEPSAELQAALVKISRGRGRILLCLWMLLTATVIAYDLRFAAPLPTSEEGSIAPAAPSLKEAVGNLDIPTAIGAPSETREKRIDHIKSFYEDAFVSYYYLTKCGVGQKADEATLYHGLVTELLLEQAEADASKVIDAARGSFEVIYSESPCDVTGLAPVAHDFRNLINKLPLRLTANKPAKP